MEYTAIIQKMNSYVPFLNLPLPSKENNYLDLGVLMQGGYLSLYKDYRKFIDLPEVTILNRTTSTIETIPIEFITYEPTADITKIFVPAGTPVPAGASLLISENLVNGKVIDQINNMIFQALIRFNVGFKLEEALLVDDTNLEEAMQTITAQMVCCYLLEKAFAEILLDKNSLQGAINTSSTSDSSSTSSQSTYMSKAVAGVTSVEWSALTAESSVATKVAAGGLNVAINSNDALSLFSSYMQNLHRMANQLSSNTYNYQIDYQWVNTYNQSSRVKNYEGKNKGYLLDSFLFE